ncbi:MAG: DUF5714 domain-containing protein [Coriobacteriia bacterium]|nr:DUF5714 domain-containing protein [Coriobacteriia bacterium]
MAGALPNCLICGADLVYASESTLHTCAVCGKEEMGTTACEGGHYVCNTCHRQGGVDFMRKLCVLSRSKNAVEILTQAMEDKSVYPNGPEHHTMVGAALLTAYYNAGGKIGGGRMTKGDALKELQARSMQVPGGTCGFWGCCGAATSAGQALSIINGSTPLKRDEWGQCQRLTSTILGHLADQGGPRCCKRTGYTALLDGTDFLNEHFNVRMERPESVTCRFRAGNKQCLRRECPYFPKKGE